MQELQITRQTRIADEGVTVSVTAQSTVTAERESELLASVPTGLLINGEWRPAASGKTFDVEDPSTGKVLLSIADAGAEDGMAALDAAAAAQESWAKVSAAGARRDPAPRI